MILRHLFFFKFPHLRILESFGERGAYLEIFFYIFFDYNAVFSSADDKLNTSF